MLVCLSWAAGWEQARPGLHSAAGCAGSGMCDDSEGPALSGKSRGCRAQQSRTRSTSCRSHSASHPHPRCVKRNLVTFSKKIDYLRREKWYKFGTPVVSGVTHTTEQAKEPFWVWLSLIRKVPSLLPLSSSSASFRLILPAYQLCSSWWLSSAKVYGLRDVLKRRFWLVVSLTLI